MGTYFTAEHIKNQFITNPDWREVFLKHHPDWTPETWLQCALDVLKKNNCTLTVIKRYSGRLQGLIEVAVHVDGEWMYEQQLNDFHWEEKIIVRAICDYEIDFSKFK